MSLSVSRQLAVIGGVALPLIETARRWHQLAEPAMLPSHWGRGLFREAAGLALRFAFDDIRPRELEAWVVEDNARANRAMTESGPGRHP